MKKALPVKPESSAPTRRLPCLVVVRGSERGRIIPIGRASMTLGRAKATGIRVDERGVSRRHARFHVRRGNVSLQDLKSTNGTWCNGRKVQETILKDGDQLQFGACLATFRLNHPEERRLLTRSEIVRIIRAIRIITEVMESAQEIDHYYRAGGVRRAP